MYFEILLVVRVQEQGSTKLLVRILFVLSGQEAVEEKDEDHDIHIYGRINDCSKEGGIDRCIGRLVRLLLLSWQHFEQG